MKRKLLCGLLAALTLTCATVKAAPSRVVPVQVDGTVLSQGVNYLQSGVTYVPLRGLLDAFGGWSVWWDSSRKVAAAASGSQELDTLLAGDKDALSDFLWGRDVLDLATEYPASFESAEAFVGILKKIMPRLYSIASSPNAHPEQVHLCVGAVRYTARDRKRGGVCSTYMADRLQPGHTARVFVHTNKNFRLPEDGDTPIIMVGPGTGIAPFRAFWEERAVSGAKGGNWLFFGNPYRATDFCYEDELNQLTGTGKLKLSVAWSRDQEKKVYVQHLMVQEGEELWKWLEAGACFYVCGDASRMAKDVDNALHEVIQTWGHKTPEEAAAYVADMKQHRRYQRDVY